MISSAGFLLPRPKRWPSLSPSLRGGVPFFATHLRTSPRNLPSGGPKPDESRLPRIATDSHSPARELNRTAVEVAEILAHLFEREPEGKKALRGVNRHTERQTLVAKRGDHPGAFVEGGFGCLERRGFAPGGQRVCASALVSGRAFLDAQEQRSQSRLGRLGKRLRVGPPEHDEVVTEPEQRPPQRSQVWLGGEKADPLVLRFVGDRMCLRHCLANGVLDPLDRRRIERPQKPLKQLRQQLRHQFKRPRSGFDRDGVRAGREDQKRYRERGYASNRDLEHPVDRGFNRAHVSECRNQQHQHAGERSRAEAPA